MSVDQTVSGVMNAVKATETAAQRLRVAVAEALRKELRMNLPGRFQYGAVERYGYPPYAASTLARKTTPPLVETGEMRRAVLNTLRVMIDRSNLVTATVSGPRHMRIQYEAGRDFMKPLPHEMRRLISRIRVLPQPTM